MNNESDMKRGVSSVNRHYNPSILSETAMDKLTEMESVLKWASDNVWWIRHLPKGWSISPHLSDEVHHAPTLYEALLSAWKADHKEERNVK